ncbi:MAG TPA: DUF3857 domain-containing transglutaminase family protein, partial [Spirochaetia bacterium]|nr:DUF3857 domain-containing transglutaminase family protein [Spirochaetia bacterium]
MRRWRHSLCASLLAAATLLVAPGVAVAEDFQRTFTIAPPPSWVLPQGSLALPTHGADEGESYLLSDSQENVATGERFTNIVKEMRTAEGVQDGSTISVDYDPSYQTLQFHRILVVRGGSASSRLSRRAVRLIQREPDLESSMLDGAVTASFVLQDIRPGDRIDYAYTIRGRNPALGGRFADSFPYGWQTALGRERVRVLCPTSRVLRYRSIGGTAEPRVTAKGSTTEYLWEFSDSAPILWEDQSPSWHVTYPWVEISEYPDWAAVDRWAQSLYPPAKLPPELGKLTTRWSAEHAAAVDRLQAALDYVQQEVRYVAIELGTGSLTPRAPQAVWARRFGDCKDKSYLLVSLLSRLGLQAAPVLVNTGDRTLVADRLPSPYAFDHVIVAVTVNGKRVFVDPTDAYQRGPVLKRFLPDYGYGLILAPGQTQLVRFGSAQGAQPETRVVERFTTAGQDEPASLEVTTTASGGAADNLRAAFATHTIDEVAKSYLNYYASDYPQIESVARLDVRDDAAQDVFTTVERYRIPGFWTLLSDKRNYRATLFPSFVYGLIPMPKTKIRTSPIEVPYPKTVDERIEVSLPEAWPARSESATITTAAFELKTDYAARGTTVVLEHRYRSLADSIPAAAVPGYNEAVKDIDQRLGYRLTWQAKGVQ